MATPGSGRYEAQKASLSVWRNAARSPVANRIGWTDPQRSAIVSVGATDLDSLRIMTIGTLRAVDGAGMIHNKALPDSGSEP